MHLSYTRIQSPYFLDIWTCLIMLLCLHIDAEHQAWQPAPNSPLTSVQHVCLHVSFGSAYQGVRPELLHQLDRLFSICSAIRAAAWSSEPRPSTLALFLMLMQTSPVGLLGPIRCCLCQPAASLSRAVSLSRAADGLLLKEQLSAAGMATEIASQISQEIVWRSPCDLFQTCAKCQYLQNSGAELAITELCTLSRCYRRSTGLRDWHASYVADSDSSAF